MGDLLKSLAQNSISSRTVSRVPFRQPLRPPCRYSAPMAQQKALSTVFSPIGYYVRDLFLKVECFLTWILSGGVISLVWTQNGNTYHLFTPLVIHCCLLCCLLPLLILRRVCQLWANLVVIHSLLKTLKEAIDHFVVLRIATRALWPLRQSL